MDNKKLNWTYENLYGGLSDYENGDGYDKRIKSLGRFDNNGKQIRCTPKQQFNKNAQAKQKTKYLVHYDPTEPSYNFPKKQKNRWNDITISFPEWDIIQIREAYTYKNSDNETVINPRWKPYLRPTQTEKQIQKSHVESGNRKLRVDELAFIASLRE